LFLLEFFLRDCSTLRPRCGIGWNSFIWTI
jgi:hypothetical protein